MKATPAFLTALLVCATVAAQEKGPAGDDVSRLERLAGRLGDEDYKSREAAEKELLKAGSAAIPALVKVAAGGNAEAKLRARRLLMLLGGWDSRAVKKAVVEGVDWLLRHQSDDGRWDMDGFTKNCRGGGMCPAGTTVGDFDEGVTALALLALLGSRGCADGKKWRPAAARATTWLLGRQDGGGWIGKKSGVGVWMYNHVIATLALCRAAKAGVLDGEDGGAKMKKAVRRLIEARSPGVGWSYVPSAGGSDTSLTAWAVKALAAAEAAGVAVPKSTFAGAFAWLDRVLDPGSGRVGYRHRGDSGAVIMGVNEKYAKLPAMTAAALAAQLSAGRKTNEAGLRKSLQLVLRNRPEWDEKRLKVDMYYWLHAAEALAAAGAEGPAAVPDSEAFGRWRATLVDLLLAHQNGNGCLRGSWDPVGKWGMVGGRVYSTAACLLMLESLLGR